MNGDRSRSEYYGRVMIFMPVGKSRIDGTFIEVFGLVANDGVGFFRIVKKPFVSFMLESTNGYTAQSSLKTLLLCFELWILGVKLTECVIIFADSILHVRASLSMLARWTAF